MADSSNERAFAVLTDMFKGTGATLIASEDLITEARIVDFQEDDRRRKNPGQRANRKDDRIEQW